METEIGGYRVQIADARRQETEIWTRVMGYYRPVSQFNIGKKQEHKERKPFSEEAAHAGCNSINRGQ